MSAFNQLVMNTPMFFIFHNLTLSRHRCIPSPCDSAGCAFLTPCKPPHLINKSLVVGVVCFERCACISARGCRKICAGYTTSQDAKVIYPTKEPNIGRSGPNLEISLSHLLLAPQILNKERIKDDLNTYTQSSRLSAGHGLLKMWSKETSTLIVN